MTLRARVLGLRGRATQALTDALVRECPGEETVAGLVAGQPGWIQAQVVEFVQREMMAGRTAARTSRAALALLDEIEELLSAKVLEYPGPR
ncbi:hypothetical protein [Streptomyces sp. NPDC049585]|uniref:hypothetical protein n=1 Tax=Streptomyces sp. NPDC049585 TaxID=3155154 RepID=UPI003430CD01